MVSANLTPDAEKRFGQWGVLQKHMQAIKKKTKKVLCICWYQLLDEGRMVGWWIFVVVDEDDE